MTDRNYCILMTISNRNQHGLSRMFRIFGFLAVLTLITLGYGLLAASAGEAAPAAKAADAAIVAKCKADLARRLKLQAREIKVIETQATTWPDAALGMPEIDKVYAQVQTPGWKIILDAQGTPYLYTTSTKAIKYGGPVALWMYSMLYVMPVPDDPDLNGDLYQCSLLGTNSTRLVSGVTDYYPQQQGAVIIKRRTSRSSHELLYIKAGDAGKANPLYSAFDFGAAAFNEKQDTWAGFVRPAVAAAWNVVVARIGQEDAKTLPLPDGVQPGQIAWSGDKVMILVKKDKGMACYEITPTAETPEWKSVGAHLFPGLKFYMLNKSESLEITQITENGKPSVEVARVWFTGDRKVKAKINGLTLRGDDLFGMRYAFIWGELNAKPATYTVDIETGEVIPGFHGAGSNIMPFAYAPLSAPYRIAPAAGLAE